MAAVDSLNRAYANVAAALEAATLNPKPSYSEQGRTVSWTEYVAMLSTQLEAIRLQIRKATPFEIRSVGR